MRPTERPYTVALFFNRAKELGLTLGELDTLDYGIVVDMMIEKQNDSEKWHQLATQEDFDNF